MEFLASVDAGACIGYLVHIISDMGDTSPNYHDKLAELYLGEVKAKSKARDTGE